MIPALNFEVFAEESFIERSVRLFFHKHVRMADGRMMRQYFEGGMTGMVRQALEGEPVPPMEPTLDLTKEMAQALMASLWKIGVRPPGITDDSERVQVLNAHIRSLEAQLAELNKHISQQVELLKGAQEIILDVAPTQRPRNEVSTTFRG